MLKKYLFRFFTAIMCILTLKRPVERDRKLFGHNGSGMIQFALCVAIIVPFVIWVATLCFSDINYRLLGNYDTDVTELKGTLEGDSIKLKATKEAYRHKDYWAILSQYTDPGNLPSAHGEKGYLLAIICAFAGIFCLSGFAVSSLISFINRVTERWKQGLLKYDLMFDKYVVIIGCNKQTANIVKLALKRDDVKYVLIQTRQDVDKMRMKLDLGLNKQEEDKLVFYFAERTSQEDIAQLRLEKAVEVYILGEDMECNNEQDHDTFNINCLELISKYMGDKHKIRRIKYKLDGKLKCHVNLENQSTFTAFKATHIYRTLDKNIEFMPFNIHELWAKKILVDNFAIYPKGENGELQVQRYLPIDGVDGIGYDSDKRVHIVVVGMNQMGTAFGMQAALLAHYPNFLRNHNLRTTITFIDDRAKIEGDYLKGRFASLFDLCRYKTVVCEKTKLIYDKANVDNGYTDPMGKGGRYHHLGENFMDLQWEFIEGNIASDDVKKYLTDIAEDTNKITTIAICFNHPQQSIASALYLPGKIFRSAHQILVYQQNSFDLINKVANGEVEWKRYKNMFPFGMIEGSYMGDAFDNTMAKLEHYLYDFTRNNKGLNKHNIAKVLRKESQDENFANRIDDLWDELGIVQKLSNIDLAESIPTRLRSIMGKTYSGYPGEISHIINNDDKLLERMAQTEHNRWLTERLMMSYRPVDKEEKREDGKMLKNWFDFYESSMQEDDREREKRLLIAKNRAHIDICSNEQLHIVDKTVLQNDSNIIFYMSTLLECCELLNYRRIKNKKNDLGRILEELCFVEKKEGKIHHSFYMGMTPVTNKQWNLVMTQGKIQDKNKTDDNQPVVDVTKDDVDNFISVLRKKTGMFFTLPSLKEWEYAARESYPDKRKHITISEDCNLEDLLKGYFHFSKSSLCPVMTLKEKQKSQLELYDMLGNVWEWTRSENEEQKGSFYFCGGSWRFKAIECYMDDDGKYNYWKTFWKPKLKSSDLGFRIIWKYEEKIEVVQAQRNKEKSLTEDKANIDFVKKWLNKNMKQVEEGYFFMESDCAENAFHHFVKVSAFKMSSIPVTQSLWNAVMGCSLKKNPSENKGGDLPQTNVSWQEIVENEKGFLKRLKDITKEDFRIPTEAEWEYAAKGGHKTELSKKLKDIFEGKTNAHTVMEKWDEAQKAIASSPYLPYSGSDTPEEVAWFNDSTTQRVGQKKANALGLYDMSGNIWEWCLDYYQTDFYKDCMEGKVDTNEQGKGCEYMKNGYVEDPVCMNKSYSAHVFRGGSWLFSEEECKNTSANYWIDSDIDNDLGFRLVLGNDKIDIEDFREKK